MTENPLHDAPRLGTTTGGEEVGGSDHSLLSAGLLTTPLSALSFWLAIALPAIYLPLLITGLSTVSDLLLFLGLFGLHLLALVGGRSYRRESPPNAPR